MPYDERPSPGRGAADWAASMASLIMAVVILFLVVTYRVAREERSEADLSGLVELAAGA